MGDKDLVINGIQPRYDGDIRFSNNGDQNFNGLFEDKEIFDGVGKERKKGGGYEIKD